ncbi:MAG: nuclear transport factor 2 family protein [Erythrobacter sp.]
MRTKIAILCALALAACEQETAAPSEEAKAAFASYVAALNEGDIRAVAKMYDDNSGFYWIERGSVQYTSGGEASASLKDLYDDGNSTLIATDNIQVAELGTDSALVSAHFDFTLLNNSGKSQFSFDGWMTVGMVRRDDGWKIAGGQTGPGEVGTQP